MGLTLSRKPGESVVIEGVGTVSVIDAGRGRAVLSFELPRGIRIWRAEIAPDGAAAGQAGAEASAEGVVSGA